MSDIVLGIDLGTTNSVVSVADGTQVRVLSDEGGHTLSARVDRFAPFVVVYTDLDEGGAHTTTVLAFDPRNGPTIVTRKHCRGALQQRNLAVQDTHARARTARGVP